MPLNTTAVRFLPLSGLVLLLALLWTGSAVAIPKGDARFAVDAHTGEVLAARNSLTRWHPASLTKMMTLYLLFDALERGKTRMNATITLSRHAARQPPSRLGLGRGGHILVRDAIQALAVKSANDIAVAVAEHVGGSEAKFVRQMNRTAKRLGMRRTHYQNASGLHHSRQVTTARDMAIMAVALMRDFPQYYHYFSQKRFRYGKRTYANSNHMLGVYPGMDGVKTGYIYKAGFNLVTSVRRGERRVIAVVMGANSSALRTRIMTGVLDSAWARLKRPKRSRIASPLSARLQPLPPLPRPRPGHKGTAVLVADAPVPPAAPAADGRTFGSEETGDYSVQIGAFLSQKDAERQLVTVMSRLPHRLGEPDPIVAHKRATKGRPAYRARLSGFDSRADAARTCSWLQNRDTDCLIVAASR